MAPSGPLIRLWNRLWHGRSPYGQETRQAWMPDAELIACTQPPPPFATALLAQDEQGMAQLLDLLFACHAKVDDMEDLSPWHECEVAWDVKQHYDRDQVAPLVQEIAPTWQDAMALSEAWLSQWRHSCGEFERWVQRRTEAGDASALSFFRAMMISRCPKIRQGLTLDSE